MLYSFDDRHRSNDFNTEIIPTGAEIEADV
jgi:hypothetical protein